MARTRAAPDSIGRWLENEDASLRAEACVRAAELKDPRWIDALAKDLLANRGKSVIVAGDRQHLPDPVHVAEAVARDAGELVEPRPEVIRQVEDGTRHAHHA